MKFTTAFLFLIAGAVMAAELRVPEGFALSSAVPGDSVKFPMFATMDDQGRLFVAESSGLDLYEELQKLTRRCQISLLEDLDKDGVFERSNVYADKLVFPMGLVWRDGKLYVADPPELVALEDTNGDNKADKRTVVLSGFGHTDNGSLHGLTFGPDGWLYMTMGQPDGYRLQRDDGTFLEGKSGALIRCLDDGSNVEVLCRGFENLVEVVFMPAGEIIGTDNWFSLPEAGVRDALVHLVEGGLYPLQLRDDGTLFPISGALLSPVATYPAVALSGLVRYTAFSFPSEYDDNLFSAQFNTRKVVRHKLQRAGSTFRSEDEDFLTTEEPDFHPSDVLLDSNGDLLVVDTGSWYVHHCPTGRIRKSPAAGGIYRITAISKRTKAEPNRNWEQQTWRKGNKRSAEGIADLITQLDAPDLENSALAARVLGRMAEKSAENALLNQLNSNDPARRLASAEALAHCGSSASVPQLLSALSKYDLDAFEEHAVIHALYKLSSVEQIRTALRSSRPREQRAAIILLDQHPRNALQRDELLPHLRATDARLQEAAFAALKRHPTWISAAVSVFESLLRDLSINSPNLNATLQLLANSVDHPAIGKLIGDHLRSSSPIIRREWLSVFAAAKIDSVPPSVAGALLNTLRNANIDDVRGIARLGTRFDIEGLVVVMENISRSTSQPDSMRLEAQQFLTRKRVTISPEAVTFLFSQLENGVQESQVIAAEILATSRLTENEQLRLLKAVSRNEKFSLHPLVLLAANKAVRTREVSGEIVQAVLRKVELGQGLSQDQIAALDRISPPTALDAITRIKQLLEARLGQQAQLMAEFEPFLSAGDPNRGHQLFLSKAGCAACHRIGTQGGLVGPDLTKIGAIRSGRDILESILLPNSTIAQGYDTYVLKTSDDEEISAAKVRTLNEEEVYRTATGNELRFRPGEIKAARKSSISLMPEGLLASLDENEIRDLLAFLQNLK